VSADNQINRWHEMITPRNKAPQPWTMKSGGSWDMLDVQPIPDEMLAELAQRYYSAGAPWNCRSMPLSDADREYMFLLYYSMQGLVARMRKAEQALALALATWTSAAIPPDDDTTVLLCFSDGEVWPGFRDSGLWRHFDATPIEPGRVTAWAHMPAGPGAANISATTILDLDQQDAAQVASLA
jgi:hypothetical protein